MTRGTRFEGGATRRRRGRGGKARWATSYDWCPYCFRPQCDPYGLSPRIAEKIDRRIEEGLCPACGSHPCRCKSVGRSAEEREFLDGMLERNRAARAGGDPDGGRDGKDDG